MNEAAPPRSGGGRALSAVALVLIAVLLALLGVWLFNTLLVGKPLERAMLADPRNRGVVVSAHFEHFINPNIVVFDVKGVAGTNSRLDVLRVFMLFAEQEQHRQFLAIQLDCKGTPRYFIRGSYFQQLGQTYETQNPVYTIRTLPANVYRLDGRVAYGPSDGSIEGLGQELNNFTSFMDTWCFSDLLRGFGHQN